MRFLYGDSTPFPLETNFIETLRAVVSASAALLHVDQAVFEGQKATRGAHADAERDTVLLDEVARSLLGALEPHMGSPAEHVAQTTTRLIKSAHPVLEAAKAEISVRRDATLREVEARMVELRNSIPQTLEAFFAKSEVPGTVSRLLWKGGPGDEPANFMVRATTPFGLEALLDVELPAGHLFTRALKLADVEKGAKVRLPTPSGWIRKDVELKATVLDAFVLTEATISPEKACFVLRRPGKPPQPGVEIVVRAEGQTGSMLRVLDAAGAEAGEVLTLDGVESTSMRKVLASLEVQLRELAKGRRRLHKATWDGAPARDLERPATLAKKLIQAVTPLTHEMRRRAATTSELVLKCELGGGRREELYIERKELIDCYCDLDPERRAFFDELGLERNDVAETAVTSRLMIGRPPPPPHDDDEESTTTLTN